MTRRVELTRADGARTPEAATVLLSVPAYRDYIVIVRSAVAHLGACFGFTIGEIADLRLAVNEACNLLVESRRPGSAEPGLECRAEVHGDLLRVTVAGAVTGTDPPDTGGFGWIILAALVDSLAWEQDGNMVRVELDKRHGYRGG